MYNLPQISKKNHKIYYIKSIVRCHFLSK